MRRLALLPLAAVVACAQPMAEASPVSPLLSGPMVGVVEPTSMRLWVESRGAVALQLELSQDGMTWQHLPWRQGSWWRLPADHCRGAAWVDGLRPDTSYDYRLRTADGLLPAPHPQHFRTPPQGGAWQDFTLAFGSCAGDWGVDPTQGIFRIIAAQAPDVFLWLGDNVYYSLQDEEWESLDKMRSRWRRQRALPALQPLLASSENLAIWDDHDYGPNDSDRDYPLRFESLRLFESYWANPSAGGAGEDGVYFSHRHGGVEIFMLDTRFDRSPDDAPLDESKQLLSEAQWQWLEAGLRRSDAPFKLVVSGMQVLADYHRFESWRLYPRDRERLLRLIREEGIPGVVLLSGDRHVGEILRREQGLPYPLYEITSSPLAAGIGESTADAAAPERLPGSEITQEHVAILAFRHGPNGPEMRYQALDRLGRPVGRPLRLLAAELRAKD